MKMKSLREKSSGDRYTDLMMKILIGDNSDNIIAIHTKLGPKTAMKYITNKEELKKNVRMKKFVKIWREIKN